MDALTWTGSLGSLFVPALTLAAAVFVAGMILQLIMGLFASEVAMQANPDGTLQGRGGLLGRLEKLNGWIFLLIIGLIGAFVAVSWVMPYGDAGILGEMSKRFIPVWIALIATFVLSILFKRKLGLYGKLFDSSVGMIGYAIVMFWVFTAIFVGVFDMIATHDPLQQISGLKIKTPGVAVPDGQDADFFPHYLLGGDNLARDIFSRVIHGSVIVMIIAPLATVFAFMLGITLGLPAGYYGGKLDTYLSNLPIEKRDTKTIADVQMVFQNPFDTLNPSMTVGRQIIRALEIFKIGNTDNDRRDRMLQLLDLVKLPREFADRMPRQLSGGQKQRVGIARAFAGDARIVVADEPVSALDVSVQAAVTDLLMEIQREHKTTLLFISHDLSIVRYLSDRVMVMYLGHVVELGTTDQVFSPPYHPYTEALLSAVPIADTKIQKKHIVLEGDIPSAMNPPSGCPFQTRCNWKDKAGRTLCETEVPPVRVLAEGHQVKCHLSDADLSEMTPVIEMAAE
ncbi:ATP-binding cassette domain-containing protein [Octadecabacter sp.]|nr:ATP-binding cassette domain-containing protein [Octadecabacter sp.]